MCGLQIITAEERRGPVEEVTLMLLPHHFCPHFTGWGCFQDPQLYYREAWKCRDWASIQLVFIISATPLSSSNGYWWARAGARICCWWECKPDSLCPAPCLLLPGCGDHAVSWGLGSETQWALLTHRSRGLGGSRTSLPSSFQSVMWCWPEQRGTHSSGGWRLLGRLLVPT